MSDMALSIAAIQEFFVTQDRCRDARADDACDAFLCEIAKIEQQEDTSTATQIDLVQLAEIWPLLELRDAMLATDRTMANINGEMTIMLRKIGTTRAHSYCDNVIVVPMRLLDNAIAAAKRINTRSAGRKQLS